MGAGHSHPLYVHAHTPLHRAAPQVKLVATVVFVMAVVSTPREAIWAFATYAVVLGVLARAAHIGVRHMTRRLLLELPFLAFALFLPFIGGGERVEVGGVSLSIAGLWGAWNIMVKGSLGVAAAVVLTATTSAPEILQALDRLRLPPILVQITSFMIRYIDVIGADMRRMRIARESRGSSPRWISQARAVGMSAGALFVRSFERGERVHVAMLSRGYAGRLPHTEYPATERRELLSAAVLPSLALMVCTTAWVLQ